MEEAGGDDVEDDVEDKTFISPFASTELSKEERLLKAKTIFQREFDRELDDLEKRITRHEGSITLVKKYLNIIRCHTSMRGDGDEKFIFDAGPYRFINTRKRAEKQNEKDKSSCTGTQSAPIPHTKVGGSFGNKRALVTEKSTLSKNNKRIPRELNQDSICHIRGKRFKKLQRFVVGNVSQWCPDKRYLASSPYKWMLYVRGPREDPEISQYVTKVSFFLDPSYHPNSVVHVIEPPFHLVRRGWGEFLVRVVIFFYLSRNKPLTIYHRLQLDRTQCGYQRGAKESYADYWIYTDIPRNTINLNSVVELSPKEENVTINEDKNDGSRLQDSSLKESDHYVKKDSVSNVSMHQTTRMSVIEMITLLDGILNEHNYSSLLNPEQRIRSKPSQQAPLVNPFKILIEGKSGVSLLKKSVKHASYGPPKKKRILTNSSCGAQYDKIFRLAAEKSKTLPCHQAVNFLLHRLPLVTDKAASQDYLRFHPYAAVSVDQYRSWSIAKQCAAQNYRSKMIRKVLLGHDSFDGSWTCKDIVIYARRHGFVPCPKLKLVHNGSGQTYVKVSPIKMSTKHKISLKGNAEYNTSIPTNNKPDHGSKVKTNTRKIFKTEGDTTNYVKNISVTETKTKETSSVKKYYGPSARPKNNPSLEFMMDENKIFKTNASKISQSKKKRSKINKYNDIQELKMQCMKPTLCEPKSILEFITSHDDDDDDDPSDVDILSLYNSTDLEEDSLNEDKLEVGEDRAQLCQFVRKFCKWLSLWKGPKPNHYTVPEILVAIAAELFMEDMFRRSLDVAWEDYDPKGKTPITIYLSDALVALKRREEFDVFDNCGLGVVRDTSKVDK